MTADVQRELAEALDHPDWCNSNWPGKPGCDCLDHRLRQAAALLPTVQALIERAEHRGRAQGWANRSALAAEEVADAEKRAAAAAIDVGHLEHQREWSRETFGPGDRRKGVLDHIRKELVEIEEAGEHTDEWIDVVILALDGAWRDGYEPAEIIAAIKAKQAKNERRTWPDWRTSDPDKAIEHDRALDPAGADSGEGR